MKPEVFKVYKVRKNSIKIEELEADGETKKFFNVISTNRGHNGRTTKVSSFESYFRTKDEAIEWQTNVINKEIEMFEKSILSKKKFLELFNQENKITQK